MIMNGWQGRVLDINLTEGKVDWKDLDPWLAENFLGGRGFNSHTLFMNTAPGTDPLGPDNILCLAPGVLTGTPLPLSSRLEVSTLSPYSGILGDGSAGGMFPTFLKLAGVDQVIVRGVSPEPVYLCIEDGRAEIRDASFLWGMNTWETVDALKEVHGRDVKVACIGQAGENLVRFASTMVDKHSSAARGSGAVWGSKGLKAIAVRGTGKVSLAEKEGFRELADADRKFFITDDFQHNTVRKYGTHIGVLTWEPGYRHFERYLDEKDIPPELLPNAWKQYESGRYACYGCPVACKNRYVIPEGPYKGEENAGLEYESIHCLGINSGVTAPEAIMVLSNLADKYGMDVIALGNTIALAKDLYARGIISERDTGGLRLEWEDADTETELVHLTALREGFGNVVAEGLYSMAKIIGGTAPDYCWHVKGLSRGVHPPGIMALAHATSTRGADHLRGRTWAYGENDGEIFAKLVRDGLVPDVETDVVNCLTLCERVTAVTDAIGRCKGAVTSWVAAVPLVWKYPLMDGVARLVSSATGVPYNEKDIETVGERIYITERAFNVRQGISAVHDRIPQKPEVRDSEQGAVERRQHAEMLREYYRVHGYDEESGVPSSHRMQELGLNEAARILHQEERAPAWDGPPLRDLSAYPHGGKRA